MLCSAAYAVMRCLSVRLSVRLSVTFVDSVKTNKHIFMFFTVGKPHHSSFFCTKRHDNIPTGTPKRGRRMQVAEVW